LNRHIAPEIQEELTSIFLAAEKQYAKKAKKVLSAPADDDEPEDLDSEPEDDEDEKDENFTDAERRAEALRAEQKLCELTGKLVLAILAGVIDCSGPLKGKLRARIQRNRAKLGPNFKEVVGYLDEPKAKASASGKKSHKSKSPQEVTAANDNARVAAMGGIKSAERVEDEDEEEDEDDPFAGIEDDEPLEDAPPRSVDEDDDEENPAADEDDMMGD
jgi:cohesin complex subunit SA-1/2